jgi:uncharacterized protein (DUF697 family)
MNPEARHQSALRIVNQYVIASAGAGLIPVPGIDVTVLAGIHLALIKKLCEHYGESFSDHAARNIVIAVGVSLVPGTIGSVVSRPILNNLPRLLGPIVMSASSAGVSYALGRVIMAHFEDGGTLASLNVKDLHRLRWWRHAPAQTHAPATAS